MIHREIAAVFRRRKYYWGDPKNEYIPNARMILKALDAMKKRIDQEEGDGLQMEYGRIILRKEDGSYDVYVQIGSLESDPNVGSE